MKTVLFIDKGADAAWSAYLKLGYLLEGWRRAALYETCAWRPAARTVRAAVPALSTILGDETDWRAVIVSDLREGMDGGNPSVHFENPFDFVGNGVGGDRDDGSDLDHAVEESPHALVRLCQMLGGIPEKVVLAGDDAAAAGTADQERPWSFAYPQSAGHFDLVERYRMDVPRPRQIICVSPRTFDEDLYRTYIRQLEDEGHEALVDTRFWERNDYPANTRFVTYDWVEGAVDDDGDDDDGLLRIVSHEDAVDPLVGQRAEAFKWLRFWAGVMCLLTVDLRSSDLKPYRLYRMNPLVTPERVRASLSGRWSEWVGAREHVAAQLETERHLLQRSDYDTRGLPDRSCDVAIRFDVPEVELMSDENMVGLHRDVPRPDRDVWEEHRQRVSTSLRKLVRSPRRALRRGVTRYRRESVFDPDVLEYCVLTEDERADLAEDLAAEELELAGTTGRRAFRFESHAEAFDGRSAEVEATVGRRPPAVERRTVFWALALGCAVGLVACLPAMLSLGEAEASTLVICALALLVPPIMLATFLVGQRRMVREAYRRFDGWLHDVAQLLGDEAVRLGLRLSLYGRVRKGWAVMRRQEHLDEPTKRGKWLQERLALIDRHMTDVTMAVGEPSCDPEVLGSMRRQPWAMVQKRIESEELYDAFSAKTCARPLNPQLGEVRMVSVPFEFVDAIELESKRIH